MTKAQEHDLEEKGLNYIVAIAKHNHFKEMAIRYIAVIPAGQQVKIKPPIAWRGKLTVYALSLQTSNQKDIATDSAQHGSKRYVYCCYWVLVKMYCTVRCSSPMLLYSRLLLLNLNQPH